MRDRYSTDDARRSNPVDLIIDEAHHFMPQGKVPDPQSGKMLHAANNLVSGGRGSRVPNHAHQPAAGKAPQGQPDASGGVDSNAVDWSTGSAGRERLDK